MKREIALLHARMRTHHSRVASAKRIIVEALDVCPTWYVGFSGGKDSTVVADLVLGLSPSANLLYGDEEWLLPESSAYFERVSQKYGAQFHHIKAADEHTPWFRTWQDDPDAIHSDNASAVYARSKGWGGAFLGLRSEESAGRKMYLRRFGALHYAKSNEQWQCNPIYNWTWRDVWAYIYTNDLDYNRAYDRMDKIGVEPKYQRIGPLAVERVLGRGQLAILKRGWPGLFNRFAAKFPEARAYV